MSKLRAAVWAVAIGVLAVAGAAMLSRLASGVAALSVVFLVACVALLSLLVALVAEIPPAVGAGAGAFAAALVALVLGLTIAVAPLQPGASRPGLADLLWLPLFALLAAVAACAAAGWLGARAGLRLAHRRRGGTPAPPGDVPPPPA